MIKSFFVFENKSLSPLRGLFSRIHIAAYLIFYDPNKTTWNQFLYMMSNLKFHLLIFEIYFIQISSFDDDDDAQKPILYQIWA